MNRPPRVFISYSWTSEDYKAIVLHIAEDLRCDGVDVVLDQWDLRSGHDKFAFMEQSIEKADKVLVLCDKEYAEKANSKEGGVGTETSIITPEVYGKSVQEKFIPVIMESFNTVERLKPDAIIHCAAWTAVDAAEDEENKAKVHAINVDGTRYIAEAAKAVGAKMLYLSTDYVFDGKGERPWLPDDKNYAPLNYYGQTKLEGEMAVAENLDKFFIVRIAWVFGLNGKNFNVITGEPDKEQYSKYVKNHHEAIVTEELWDLVEKRLKENAEKYSRKAAQGREEDVLAMIEEGMSQAEIVEYLGISIAQVKYTASKLRKEGRLEGKTAEEKSPGRQRSREVEERMEKVYAAVKDGHGNDVADYLGMKYTEAYYALKKLEQGGRIRLEETGWVAA